jgi:hypothetical protein
MLFLLLDENISPSIAAQVTIKRSNVKIEALSEWQSGRFLSVLDESILQAAATSGCTLVTYDQKTILPLLVRWGQSGISHSGVVFVDHHSIPSNDFGSLVRSLIALWDATFQESWTDRVMYLRKD